MFKSPTLDADQIDYLYSELELRFLVSAPEPREKRDRPMHTQLHQIVTDMADRRGDAPALTFKDETVTYAELARAGYAVRCRAAGARAGARRSRGDCARQADRDGRRGVRRVRGRRRVRAGQPGAEAGQVGLHPARLQRARAGHDRRAPGAAAEELADSSRRARGPAWATPPRTRPADRTSCTPSARRRRAGWSRPSASSTSTWPAILYTSGSTGKPKGVVLSHRNLVAGGAERQPVSRQPRRRRDPGGAAAAASTPASAS